MSDVRDEPLPVEPLSYSLPMEDAWGAAIRLVGTSSALLGAFQLLGSGSILTLSMTQRAVKIGFLGDWPEVMQLLIELATDAAAVGMVVGGVGVYRIRAWGRAVALWSMVAFVVVATGMWCWRMWMAFLGSGSLLMALGSKGSALYLTYMVCTHAVQMLLPVLVVVILRRAEVRQRFMGQVVG